MIVCNIKINKKLILKTILCIMFLIVLSIAVAAIYNILNKIENKDNNLINDTIPSNDIATLTKENYTNILKEVHENLNTYIGQKISFSGYVYRVNDFTDDEFVLARDMDIGNKQTLIVGFLCSHDNAKNYSTYSWVKIIGEITKGTYQGQEIPIVKINEIEKIEKPENANVTMPEDAYVPTAVIY